jgi:glycerol uptake facilitator-like aquaporin
MRCLILKYCNGPPKSEQAQHSGLQKPLRTGGLLFVILRSPEGKASSIVACYIGAAYWFTASTAFANPAAAFGRMFSNTFAGIAPVDVPAFVVAQIVGGFLGLFLHLLLKSDHPHSH